MYIYTYTYTCIYVYIYNIHRYYCNLSFNTTKYTEIYYKKLKFIKIYAHT